MRRSITFIFSCVTLPSYDDKKVIVGRDLDTAQSCHKD